jgi:hypothetical protein
MMTSMPPTQKMEKLPVPQSPVKREGGGTGWVLVNVEGKPRPEGEGLSNDRPAMSQDTSRTLKADDLKVPKSQSAATLSPVAKSVVIIDAKDAKQSKGKGKAKDAVSTARPSGLRRLLSFSKRGEMSDELATEFTAPLGDGAGEQRRQRKPSALRDRLKRKGVPEASPRSVDDKRLSIN